MKKIIFYSPIIIAGIIALFDSGCKPSFQAMDIVSPAAEMDDNFLLKNPVWGVVANGTPPEPSVNAFCPVNSFDPNTGNSAGNCTSQGLHYNEPYWAHKLWCGDGGHMNYFPVTYEANICWGDHSGGDDDYNFRLHRDDKALFTTEWPDDLQLQAEFDSDETVDDWDNTETFWNDFHHKNVDNSDQSAHDAIDGKFAIVIGLAGFDYEHGVHTELHPVYAMFIHVKDDPNDDKWAFFLRNWGDEGYCSDAQEYFRNFIAGDETIKVKIPHADVKDADILTNIHHINDHNHKLSFDFDVQQDGVLMTFHLDAPEAHTTFVGDLTIHWKNPDKVLQPRNDFKANNCNPNGSPAGTSSQPLKQQDESGLTQKIKRLDSASKKELIRLVNEQFRHSSTDQKDTLIKRVHNVVKALPRKEKIDYSKMIYQVKDSATAIRKTNKINFKEQYLKSKGIE